MLQCINLAFYVFVFLYFASPDINLDSGCFRTYLAKLWQKQLILSKTTFEYISYTNLISHRFLIILPLLFNVTITLFLFLLSFLLFRKHYSKSNKCYIPCKNHFLVNLELLRTNYIFAWSSHAMSETPCNELDTVRNCRPQMFYKKGVLKSFAKFFGKHLCKSRIILWTLRNF